MICVLHMGFVSFTTIKHRLVGLTRDWTIGVGILSPTLLNNIVFSDDLFRMNWRLRLTQVSVNISLALRNVLLPLGYY